MSRRIISGPYFQTQNFSPTGCKSGSGFLARAGRVAYVSLTNCVWDGDTVDSQSRPLFTTLPSGIANVSSVWNPVTLQGIQSTQHAIMFLVTGDAKIVCNMSGLDSENYLKTTPIYTTMFFMVS